MKKRSLILLPFVIATASFADGYTAPSIDVAPVLATLGAVAAALAGIWAVKKIVKLLNKS